VFSQKSLGATEVIVQSNRGVEKILSKGRFKFVLSKVANIPAWLIGEQRNNSTKQKTDGI
jgi:phage I-like protein